MQWYCLIFRPLTVQASSGSMSSLGKVDLTAMKKGILFLSYLPIPRPKVSRMDLCIKCIVYIGKCSDWQLCFPDDTPLKIWDEFQLWNQVFCVILWGQRLETWALSHTPFLCFISRAFRILSWACGFARVPGLSGAVSRPSLPGLGAQQ